MVSSAVITCAGRGTRNPYYFRKEMLPLFFGGSPIHLSRLDEPMQKLFPNLHLIMNQLMNVGVKYFIFVVNEKDVEVREYFESLKDVCKIRFVVQKKPNGFGDAVLQAERYLRHEREFFVYAGDNFLLNGENILRSMSLGFPFIDDMRVATMLYREVQNPSGYGVIQEYSTYLEKTLKLWTGSIQVLKIEEKPPNPHTNFGVAGIYTFKPEIFDALRAMIPKSPRIYPDQDYNLELTPAIQYLINQISIKLNYPDIFERMVINGTEVVVPSHIVHAFRVPKNVKCLSVGSPKDYIKALNATYRQMTKIYQ